MPITGGNLCYLPRGKGRIVYVLPVNPANITPIVITVPANRIYFWHSHYCGALMDAAAGNRYYRVLVQTDTGRTLWQYRYGLAQLANESRAYAWNPTNRNYNTFHFSSVHTGPLPKLWLLPGTVITLDMEGWQLTDHLYSCHQTFAEFAV